ncbi:MAG: hypothetical protein GY755_09555 [Chloroflexi bacterium]|nr:hypothetical protein [Chloroflexota bacterium]
MKEKYPILFPILALLSLTIACSLFSKPTAPSTEILFEEKEFNEAGCFFDNSTDEITYFVEEGAFHIDVLVPEWYALSPCLGKDDFSDFVFEVDATQVTGPDHNLYGVMLRYNDVTKDYYYFGVSGEGNYTLVYDNLDIDEPTTKLVHWKHSSAINTGASTNHIKAVLIGDSIALYVNDQLLETVQDAHVSSGTVGFIVSTSDKGGSHIKFDNVVVTTP